MKKEENKKYYSLRLSKPKDIRRSLARVANMVINERIDTKAANSIVVACNAILGAIRVDEQQKKLEELEAIIKRNKLG